MEGTHSRRAAVAVALLAAGAARDMGTSNITRKKLASDAKISRVRPRSSGDRAQVS